MRELLQILLGLLVVAAFLWVFVKVGVLLKEHGIDIEVNRTRVPKVEIQTLFHGNTKDEDQI